MTLLELVEKCQYFDICTIDPKVDIFSGPLRVSRFSWRRTLLRLDTSCFTQLSMYALCYASIKLVASSASGICWWAKWSIGRSCWIWIFKDISRILMDVRALLLHSGVPITMWDSSLLLSESVLCWFTSIAIGCIYTEAKGYPRESAAHVAIRKLQRES